MTAGTTLSVVQAALKTRWEARPGLAGMTVHHGPPPTALSASAIWWETTNATVELDDLRAGSKEAVEEWTGKLILQVLDSDTDKAALDAVVALLAEIQADLAADITVSGLCDWCQLTGWECQVASWQGRWLARIDCDIETRAHLDVP